MSDFDAEDLEEDDTELGDFDVESLEEDDTELGDFVIEHLEEDDSDTDIDDADDGGAAWLSALIAQRDMALV